MQALKVSVGTIVVALLAATTAASAQKSPAPSPQDASSASSERAFLKQHCVACHNERTKTAGLSLDSINVERPEEMAATWEKVVRKLRAGMMPPAGRPRPDASSYESFIRHLEGGIDRAAAARPNPGRKDTFHRLNRVEYGNAIRDLLGLEVNVTELLPVDDGSFGFDNMAGVLKLNQSLMERYLGAAQKLSALALGRVSGVTAEEFRVSNEYPQTEHIDGLPLGTRGGISIPFTFPVDGEYDIKIKLMCGPPSGIGVCDGSGGFADAHQLEVSLDGERMHLFTLERRPEGTTSEKPWEVRLPVKAGPHTLVVTFLQPPSVEETEAYRRRFQKPLYRSVSISAGWATLHVPAVSSVTVSGPFNAGGPGDTPSRRRLLVCRPAKAADEAACAKTILSTLARRAYRRPVTDGDLAPLLEFYEQGRGDGGFEAGLEMALRRILTSPQFLFRIERDPANTAAGQVYRITDLELASRLSFFLWSSVPDDELLDVAARGRLKDAAVLERQVRRMLADERAGALIRNFIGQWLQLRNVDAKRMSEELFPDFDDRLRKAFQKETELFVTSVLRDDRSVTDMLTANYTFVNERLAVHYGLQGVKGSHFRKVVFPADNPRRGLLSHGSILLVSSHPIRTSPVLRGKWILTNILGTPPPDPPANVPPLEERDEASANQTILSVRERMAKHRANPICASCHTMIDPLGFALENFDAVGRWRNADEAFNPIDASGALPNGAKFSGWPQFREILAADPRPFVTLLTEKLLTYALGRGLEHYDMPAVRAILGDASATHYRFSSLLVGIVKSVPFQMRAVVPTSSEVQAQAQHR